MKNRIFATCIVISLNIFSLVYAETFDASGVILLGQAPSNNVSDIWGYVSPSGREYAIIGLYDGVDFVEVSDPRSPSVVGYVGGPASAWRDMKVFNEFCYVVVDSNGDGLQIIDLTQIDSGTVTLYATDTLNGSFFEAHNIALNTDSGYAYPINAGFTALNLSDPKNPLIEGSTWNEYKLHDALVVSYGSGIYAGKEILFGFAGASGITIVDVSDKSNYVTLSIMSYPNVSYAHQGWISEDRRFLFIGDEDDLGSTTTYVANIEDLSNPQYIGSFTNGLNSIDHNMMVRGNYLFEANYSSGLRIYDISDPGNVGSIQEVGYFDTYPENDDRSFNGAWGVYTGLPSGIVILSDQERGLFVFDVSAVLTIPTISGWRVALMIFLFSITGIIFIKRKVITQ